MEFPSRLRGRGVIGRGDFSRQFYIEISVLSALMIVRIAYGELSIILAENSCWKSQNGFS